MSPFSQPSSNSAPVSNPFAPRANPFAPQPKSDGDSGGFGKPADAGAAKFQKRKHPLAQEITFESDDDKRKARSKSPFLSDDTSGDDSKKNKGPRRPKHVANGSSKGFPSNNASAWNGAKGTAKMDANSPQPFPTNGPSSTSIDTNDPHSRRVYEQLHKDNIYPPQWPSQPGDPSNKAQMARFREQYEAYRDKVRASLTKAGLIDDPEKRKTLQDAIDFKGICEDMCPEYEKIQRITELDVHQPEKDPNTTFANTARMVKKLARSAAGQEAPLPMDVRSVRSLRRTLDYLIDDLLKSDGNLPVLHGFLWDRTRAIRRDFTFFSSLTPEELLTQVYVLENIARFHVTALHLLSQEGVAPEDFVEQQELEQLGKALLSLRDLYDDCDAQGITCKNEAEFRAYYLVFHANDPNILETLQRQWRPSLWRDSDEVRTAVSLVEALQNTDDFHGPLKDAPSLAASGASHAYFRIMQDPSVSYTMACFAECHLPSLRRAILKKVKKALARPKETAKDVTAAVLNRFLHFDTIQEAIDFAELHDLEFSADEENPLDLGRKYLLLNNKAPLPHPRLQHQFSQTLVERKRGSVGLPKLIHETVADSSSGASTTTHAPGKTTESSLFVQDKAPSPFAKPTPVFSQASVGTKASSPFQSSPATQSSSPFSNPSSIANAQTQPAANPFAPTPQAATNLSSSNPFAPSIPNASSSASQIIQPSKLGDSSSPSNSQQSAQPGTFNFLSKTPSTNGTAAPTPAFTNFVPGNNKPASSSAAPVADAPSKSPFSFGTTQLPETTASAKDSSTTKEADKPAFIPPTVGVTPTSKPLENATAPKSAPLSFPSFKPAPSPAPTDPKNISATPTIQVTPPSDLNLSGQSSLPPTQATTTAPSIAQAVPSIDLTKSTSSQPTSSTAFNPISQPPPAPQEKPLPPRDLFGDFTKWFVMGDDGLLEQFEIFTVENLVTEVFQAFEIQQEERRLQEEEEYNNQVADEFRVRNLSVKYFYLWKHNARERRLRELRRSGREQFRAYHEAQRTAKLMAQEKAARELAREREQLAKLDRIKEMRDVLKSKNVSKRKAEKALLASGVLAGVGNEQEAIAAIVGKMPGSSPAYEGSSRPPSPSPSEKQRKEGAKTKALREMFHPPSLSSSFRRSLPAMASRGSTSPSHTSPVSRASERWRLKAMGIVQMPDGTAVPESLANDVLNRAKKYSQLGYGSYGGSQRRASTSSTARKDLLHGSSIMQPSSTSVEASDNPSLNNKRKRPEEDEDGTSTPKNGASETGTHKRLMSETENTINELRALRAELEEGTAWFKSQNEKLRDEMASRGSTPWEESM